MILITNNPSYLNSYMYLSSIDVYLNNDLFPTIIYGLFPIVYEQIKYSDANAFISNSTTNLPFISGFKNYTTDTNGITIGQLVDSLSNLTIVTPVTNNKVKKFVLTFDPPQLM